jgi:hypothetical protein
VGQSNGNRADVIGTVDSSYQQYAEGFMATCKLNRMSFDCEIGYIRRTSDDGGGDTLGLAGLSDLED